MVSSQTCRLLPSLFSKPSGDGRLQPSPTQRLVFLHSKYFSQPTPSLLQISPHHFATCPSLDRENSLLTFLQVFRELKAVMHLPSSSRNNASTGSALHIVPPPLLHASQLTQPVPGVWCSVETPFHIPRTRLGHPEDERGWKKASPVFLPAAATCTASSAPSRRPPLPSTPDPITTPRTPPKLRGKKMLRQPQPEPPWGKHPETESAGGSDASPTAPKQSRPPEYYRSISVMLLICLHPTRPQFPRRQSPPNTRLHTGLEI